MQDVFLGRLYMCRFFLLKEGYEMTIHKVINNNIVVILDASGKELILMGRGIGFKKHPGDVFDERMIEKKFTMAPGEQSGRLSDLLNEIPIQEIDAAVTIMETALQTLDKKLNEGTIISLSDHIHTSIERSRDNIFVKNVLLWEIKKFYPEEYKIGRTALDIIQEKTGILLPEDEAGFIALHIVNAQMEDSVGDMYGLTKVMQEIINIIKYTCRVSFDEESVYYYRFITHLKFFAQRLLTHTTCHEDGNDKLLEVVREQYHESYQCVRKITEFIVRNYDYCLSGEEQLYLTIHIERIVKKSK